MALFNKANFEKLMEKLTQGNDLIVSLESLAVLSIPLEIARQHNLMDKMRALAPYLQMTDLCSTIMGKLVNLQKEEEKKKAKKDANNEKRRLHYRRKREAEKRTDAKKSNESDSQRLGHLTNVQGAVEAGSPIAAVTKKNAPALKTGVPKKAAKKPTLLQKALKDAFKIRKQFK